MCLANKVLIIFILFKFVNCFDNNIASLSVNNITIYGRRLYTVYENKPYIAYWKIPYAEAPIRHLRFKPPKGLLLHETTKFDYSLSYNESCAIGRSEDCLYLSIYMPMISQTYKHPVIVWIHENSYEHGPDFLIDEDVIVVTVSYRTDLFGFLNTGDDFSTGNMGSKDILEALKWIKEYIVYFGGDKEKVTVIGSGKAANSVASFLLTPVARDLFARLVIQSGSALTPADYNNFNFEILSKLLWNLKGPFNKFNRTELYNELTKASMSKLLLAAEDLFDSTEVRDNQRVINSFGPTVETVSNTAFINNPPLEAYKRGFINNNVDVMIGFTNLESIYKLKGFIFNRKLLKYLTFNFQYLLPFEGKKYEYKSKKYNRIRQKIMDFYFVNGTIGERSLRRYAKYVSDQVIYPILRQVRLHVYASTNNVYLYRFAYKGCLNIVWGSILRNLNMTGATAGDEICYQFKCKSLNEIYESKDSSEDRRFVKKIAKLLANFAKHGNPTPTHYDEILGDLRWEPLTYDQRLRALNLSKKIKMIFLPEEKQMKFWDDLRNELLIEEEMKEEL